jgi:anti-sigma B factor antagonist
VSHSVPLPPALPPRWTPGRPAVPRPASPAPPSSGSGRRPADRQRWDDRLGIGDRAGIPALQVRSLTAADSCTVTVSGEVDSLTAPGLQEVLLEVLDRPQSPGGVVLDLSRVTFLGAVGLTVLAVGHHLAENAGGVLRIRCGSSRAVIRPLQATGLWDVLHVVEREGAENAC